MLLRVTKEDIEAGIPYEEDSCPIAHALYRRGFSNVRVGRLFIRVRGQRCRTPARARDFIWDFDDDNSAEPTTFRLPLTPPKPQKKGGG